MKKGAREGKKNKPEEDRSRGGMENTDMSTPPIGELAVPASVAQLEDAHDMIQIIDEDGSWTYVYSRTKKKGGKRII